MSSLSYQVVLRNMSVHEQQGIPEDESRIPVWIGSSEISRRANVKRKQTDSSICQMPRFATLVAVVILHPQRDMIDWE